jgi:hypothetical protein
MASLILSFSDVYSRVSDFLGLGTSPTGTNLTKVKDITYRAYRKFLFPLDTQTKQVYVWSFLRKTGTLITEANKYEYVLPEDFVGLVSGFKYDAGENKDNPQKIDVSKLRALRSQSIATASNPDYYAIKAIPYNLDTGANYSVLFYKTPSGSVTFKYEYIFDPEKPSATTDIFVGGVRGSEVIMQLALGVAELQDDDTAGPQEAKAQEMLAAFMAYDQQYIPNAVEIDPELQESIPNFRRERLIRRAMGQQPTGEV